MASRGVNKAIILGTLGKDPETRYAASGDAICNLSVATSETWKNAQGEPQEKTEWHKIVGYKKLAEIMGQYLTKGQKVYIEGRIETRKWQDQSGNDRYTTQIVASEMQMLGGGEKQENKARQQPAPQQTQEPDFIDDVPF